MSLAGSDAGAPTLTKMASRGRGISPGASRVVAIMLVALAARFTMLVRAQEGAAGGMRSVTNAQELAAAFIDNSISTIVPTADMEMTEASWVGLGPLPVLVTRNVTLTSQRDDNATWPVISFGFVPDKLQLQPGVYFIWTKIVCRRTREAPHFLAPGLDMLRPTLPAPSPNSSLEAYAHVQFNDMMIMNRGCIPVELAITMANQVLSISSRPTVVPGMQRARTQIVNNCTGVNNTGLRPTLQCFPVTNYYGDLALYGAYIPTTYVPQRSGYIVYCKNTPGQCEDMLETSCVTTLGPVECYWKTYGKVRAISNSTNTSSPAANSAVGGNSSNALAASPRPANGTAVAAGAGIGTAQQQGDTSSSSSSVVLGAVLGGVLGGLVLLGVMVAAVLLWRRRRAGAAAAVAAQQAGKEQSGGDGRHSHIAEALKTDDGSCNNHGAPPPPHTAAALTRGASGRSQTAAGKPTAANSFSARIAAALSVTLAKRQPSLSLASPAADANNAVDASSVLIGVGASHDVAHGASSATTAAAASAGESGSLLAATGLTRPAAIAAAVGRRASTESITADSAAVARSGNLRDQAALLDTGAAAAAAAAAAGDAGSGGAAQRSLTPVTPWTPLQQGLELRVKAKHAVAAAGGNSGAAQSTSNMAGASTADSSAESAAGSGTASGSTTTGGGFTPSSGPSSSADSSNEVKLLPITLGKGTFGRVVVGEFRGQRVAVKLVNLNLAGWAPPPLPAAAAAAPGGTDTATSAGQLGGGCGGGGPAATKGGDLAVLAGGTGSADPTRYLWEQASASHQQQPHLTLGLCLSAPGTGDAGAGAAALAGFAAAVAAAGPLAWGAPGAARMPHAPAGLPVASERWQDPDAAPAAAGDAASDTNPAAAATAAAQAAQQPAELHQPLGANAPPLAASPAPAAATTATASVAHWDAGAVAAALHSTAVMDSTTSNLQWIMFPRGLPAEDSGSAAATAEPALCSLPAQQQPRAPTPVVAAAPAARVPAALPGGGEERADPPAAALRVSDAASTAAPSTAPAGEDAGGGAGLLTALPTLDGQRKMERLKGGAGGGGRGKGAAGDDETNGPDTVPGASTYWGSTTTDSLLSPAHAAGAPPPATAKADDGGAAAKPPGPLTVARNQASGLQKSFISEVEVLARIQHPNIVQLLAACIEPPQMCLVIELMDTSLERLLYGRSGAAPGPRQLMPLGKVLHVAIQVCEALSYLHPTIIHRDLKPGNVLISKPDSPTPIVKLADFGLSKLQTTVQFTWHADAGTAAYMAPETLNPYNHVVMHHVDMYAVGVILWEMLAGQRPWAGLSIAQIAYSVGLMRQRPPLDGPLMPPFRCPPKLRSLITACWDQDPKRRPAASEVLKELTLLQIKVSRDIDI